MKKSLWMAGMIFSTLFAVTVVEAADSPQTPRDQVFVQQLAQQAEAPASPALDVCPTPVATATYCPGVYCIQDSDCWDHCIGGVGASYCNRLQHACYPY